MEINYDSMSLKYANYTFIREYLHWVDRKEVSHEISQLH